MECASRYFGQQGGSGYVSLCFEQITRQRLPLKLRDRLQLTRPEAQLWLKRKTVLNV